MAAKNPAAPPPTITTRFFPDMNDGRNGFGVEQEARKPGHLIIGVAALPPAQDRERKNCDGARIERLAREPPTAGTRGRTPIRLRMACPRGAVHALHRHVPSGSL